MALVTVHAECIACGTPLLVQARGGRDTQGRPDPHTVVQRRCLCPFQPRAQTWARLPDSPTDKRAGTVECVRAWHDPEPARGALHA